ncbi:C-type lectin lectoxin-Enh6-like [Elgaria multicarinata webbii]|uniref:C-type lectin lectoxin-Enh6-like n=1 Tax=Elgaria multicarinata webbii TaxID=159646 RepID=UPI002FCCD006
MVTLFIKDKYLDGIALPFVQMGPVASLPLSLLGLLVTTFFLQGAKAANCPRHWIKYADSCFGLFPEKLTWAEAEMSCQSRGIGGHLASFTSESELTVVAKYILNTFPTVETIWIGMEDPQKTRRWRWSDSNPVTFIPWNAGEPNNNKGNEYCVQISVSQGFLKFNDVDCKMESTSLCKSVL